jgi:hypothetical protein
MAKRFGAGAKIEDGDDHRARPTVVLECCVSWVCCVMNHSTLLRVMRFPVKNRRGEVVGEIRASFGLRVSDML